MTFTLLHVKRLVLGSSPAGNWEKRKKRASVCVGVYMLVCGLSLVTLESSGPLARRAANVEARIAGMVVVVASVPLLVCVRERERERER